MVTHPALSVTVITGADLERVDALRARATTRDDLAWVCARPPSTRDQYASLTQDLLAAMGVVGLGTPRANGDRHPVRVMAHLRTSPVRHVVITEAQWLAEEVLSDIGQALLICGVHLTLLAAPPIAPGWLAWAREHAGAITPVETVARRLPAPARRCALAPEILAGVELWAELPNGCDVHVERAACVVSAVRRAVSSGRMVAAPARQILSSLATAIDSAQQDWWGLRAAGLDLFTPCIDALRDAGYPDSVPAAGEVSRDGSSIASAAMPPYAWAALARQRVAAVWSNGLAEWPLESVFDRVPGVR